MTKRLGVLTGGGDCPGLNAVIRAAVKTAVVNHSFEVIGIELGFEGLIHNRSFPLTLDTIRGILPKGGTLLRTSNRGNILQYPAEDGSGRREDRSDTVAENFRKLGLDALLVIGGDGTLRIAEAMGKLGVPIVAVPKTIDNDLMATDYTFGFLTAVATATEAVDRLHSTGESHNRVMILEVMGRNCGWIALFAGVAGGADIILIPEIEYEPEAIVESIQARRRHGSDFDIIVVAEGARRRGGEEVYLNKAARRLGGVAYQVAGDLQEKIELEIRVTVLGHIQRGGTPISYDRILATQFGKHAIDLVAQGDFGKMVALQKGSMVSVPIADAVSRPKLVDPGSDLVETARRMGISFGDGQ
ncbi:MAG: ATP-dependent 6-phosphofructokinase [Acidobacteriota bacterium]